MSWMPIETAPKDRVILTDEGTAKYVDPNDWAHPKPKEGWYLCTLDGYVSSPSEEGMEFNMVEPHWWMEVPPLPKTL